MGHHQLHAFSPNPNTRRYSESTISRAVSALKLRWESQFTGARRNKAPRVLEALRMLLRFIYNDSLWMFVCDEGITARFFLGMSAIGPTVQVQPKWPFLSTVQAAPPRFQISIRQWSLLAGIVKASVTAAAMITPHRFPMRNVRISL